ncbi:response regulator transcription factor [Marinobacter sp. S6332]|uniref:response regulator transcription factor n=1 Tax=Marinobacter sp. S6332 TaxID=2926403 RepID=UPI001FF12786|nr:response regulator transcription factor [Marinobacter sp. S6332]MCK0165666.1 response regulator transcription factor [Marinobacter sp. S6332]
MKVVLVDGQRLVRDATACLLRSTMPGIIVITAENGAQAINEYADHAPDILITEMLLPDYSGLELCRRIHQRWRRANVLFLSSMEDAGLVKQALGLGAQGYISKNCSSIELTKAIEKSAGGEVYLEHDLATQMAMVQSGRNCLKNTAGNKLTEMTQRELEVLILTARGVPNKTIAERLNISVKTVANHLSVLKNKLEISSSLGLLHFAVDSGLVQLGTARSESPACFS